MPTSIATGAGEMQKLRLLCRRSPPYWKQSRFPACWCWAPVRDASPTICIRRCSRALTVAVDLNPLLAYVGHRVSLGEVVELTEFPLAPLTPKQAAMQRTLRAPEPARPGLTFVLADAGRPPFQAGAFDLVITPWLLDVIDGPTDPMLARINHLLADGGTWINHGSVAFQSPQIRGQLTLEELEDWRRTWDFGPQQTAKPHYPT